MTASMCPGSIDARRRRGDVRVDVPDRDRDPLREAERAGGVAREAAGARRRAARADVELAADEVDEVGIERVEVGLDG